VDLISNGRNIPVTDLNKMDYIRLISHHSMTASIRSQIINFLDGFHDLVPAELISIFSPTELELLICGLPDVDIEDLHNNTDYNQYRESEEYIQWFWETLRAFTREEKALFLQFVTGTSKVNYSAILLLLLSHLSCISLLYLIVVAMTTPSGRLLDT
jgi:E3 ubiquitin-protein ligase HUWE1